MTNRHEAWKEAHCLSNNVGLGWRERREIEGVIGEGSSRASKEMCSLLTHQLLRGGILLLEVRLLPDESVISTLRPFNAEFYVLYASLGRFGCLLGQGEFLLSSPLRSDRATLKGQDSVIQLRGCREQSGWQSDFK